MIKTLIIASALAFTLSACQKSEEAAVPLAPSSQAIPPVSPAPMPPALPPSEPSPITPSTPPAGTSAQ